MPVTVMVPVSNLPSPRQRHLPRWVMSVIIALLIFGIGLRFTNLDGKFFWNDEVITAMRTAGHTIWDFKGSFFDDRILPFGDVQYFQQLKPNSSFSDTINGLAVEDAKHTPLYFILARAWRLLGDQPLFNSPITSLRSISAVLSLLIFPSLYWLCRELFPKTPAAAQVALGFFALSPVQLLYAQEARAYSLWTAAALASSASLLRAIKQPSVLSWACYVFAASIGLYSQTLFALVLLGHGVFVLVEGWLNREQEQGWFKLPKRWWHYAGAIAAISLLFLPWIGNILSTMTMLKANTGWVTEAIPRSEVIKQWLIGLSSTFFDWDALSVVRMMGGRDRWLDYLPRLGIIVSLLAALAYTCRRAGRSAGLLLVCLIAGPVVCLMLPDIIQGGQRSAAPRYWLAAYAALQIAVAYCFGSKLSEQKATFWKGLLLAIFTLQLISCIGIIQAPTWWNKHLYNFPAVAEVINAADNPLVISDPTGANPGCIIALSYLVRPDVALQLVTPPEIPALPQGYGSVFFFDTYGEAYDSLAQLYSEQQGLAATPTSEGILWRLELP